MMTANDQNTTVFFKHEVDRIVKSHGRRYNKNDWRSASRNTTTIDTWEPKIKTTSGLAISPTAELCCSDRATDDLTNCRVKPPIASRSRHPSIDNRTQRARAVYDGRINPPKCDGPGDRPGGGGRDGRVHEGERHGKHCGQPSSRRHCRCEPHGQGHPTPS